MKKKLFMFICTMLPVFGAFIGGNPSLAGMVDLPRTGQTTCYDDLGDVISCDGTGQDGDIQGGSRGQKRDLRTMATVRSPTI